MMRKVNMSTAMRRVARAVIATLIIAASLPAVGATLTWDADTGTAEAQNGSGTWNQSNTNWWDGSANTNWDNALPDDASFAVTDNSGSTYTLTLGEDIVVGSLFLGGGNVTYVIDGAFGLTTSGIQVNNSKKLQIDVPVTLSGNQSWNQQGSASLTANQPVSGSASLSKGSVGLLTLNASNSFDGGFAISAGTVAVGHDSALGTGTYSLSGTTTGIRADGGSRTIGNPVYAFLNTTKTWIIGGTNQIEFTGDFTMQAAVVWGVLVFQTDNTADTIYSGDLVKTGTNPRGIRKTGTGRLILSGNNNYDEYTEIQSGTLLLNGTHTGGTNYTVDAGAAFGGTGTVSLVSGSTVTVSQAASLMPGADTNSVGTLTITNGTLHFAENAIYEWEYDSGVGDLVHVFGDLVLPSVATVNVTLVNGTLPSKATIFTATSLSGAADLSGWVLTGPDVAPDAVAAIEGSTDVVLAVPPPPGTVFLIR